MKGNIIVVGGSQGGLKALEAILPALPAAFPLPVVAVLHRVPLEEDRLVPLLQRICLLPVVEAEDKTEIEAGKVTIAPADYHLLVENGAFVLSIDEPDQYSRPSIDALFESAADAYGEGVTAVLLTGANDDGARGMTSIKKAGGVTIAQDPETAEALEMPRAAITAGAVDKVMSLQGIGEFIAGLGASSGVKTLPRKV